MRAFARMYRAHAAREDTVLFPAFHGALSPREYAALGEDFEDREHQLFGRGGFEGVLDEVAALERTLGIEDLARFTAADGERLAGRASMIRRSPDRTRGVSAETCVAPDLGAAAPTLVVTNVALLLWVLTSLSLGRAADRKGRAVARAAVVEDTTPPFNATALSAARRYRGTRRSGASAETAAGEGRDDLAVVDRFAVPAPRVRGRRDRERRVARSGLRQPCRHQTSLFFSGS